jgi:hypothetical protein
MPGHDPSPDDGVALLPGSGAFALGLFCSKPRPQGRCKVTWAAKVGQRRAAQRGVLTRAAQSGRNFGRASERFVSERLWRDER